MGYTACQAVFLMATLSSYGVSSGAANEVPQSMDRRGHAICTELMHVTRVVQLSTCTQASTS